MAKKRVGGAQRYRRAGASGSGSGGEAGGGGGGPSGGPLPPQHVQRRVSRKVAFLERVAASQKASLAAAGGGVSKKKRRKVSSLPTLDALAGALDEAAAASKGVPAARRAAQQAGKGRGSSVKRNKARHMIALSEAERAHAVRAHPSFRADPLGAIAHHLNATLPPPPPAPKPGGGGKAKGKNKGQKKRQAGGGGGGGASMDAD